MHIKFLIKTGNMQENSLYSKWFAWTTLVQDVFIGLSLGHISHTIGYLPQPKTLVSCENYLWPGIFNELMSPGGIVYIS